MSEPWYTFPPDAPDAAMTSAAEARQQRLTKPPGSLAQLESIGVRLATLQRTQAPEVDPVRVVVFAADHGVTEEGISAFPAEVTLAMVRNFSAGGAAINAIAGAIGAELEVVDVGTATAPGPLRGVISQRVAPGSANFTRGPALTPEQLEAALEVGHEAVARGRERGMALFVAGEMGIGNTTSAAALTAALTGLAAEEVAGPGTGLDDAGVRHKVSVIRRGLERHPEVAADPPAALRCLGGLEIAAMTGAYIAAARAGVPSVVDGFISSAAALAAVRLNPGVAPWLFLGHHSAEPGHGHLVGALGETPLLDLGLRLGEGSGAAAAVPLLRAAAAIHREMATFEDLGLT
ncbi:MAG: nicotinate-nucleotide--dimethylbenzimidazole phosphoribosyltransferase [Pseudomonadota bacterium]